MVLNIKGLQLCDQQIQGLENQSLWQITLIPIFPLFSYFSGVFFLFHPFHSVNHSTPPLIQPSTDLPSLLKIRVSRISKISLLHIKLGMQGNPFKNHIQLDRNHLKGEKRGGADYYGENRRGGLIMLGRRRGRGEGLNLANLQGTLLGAYEVFTLDTNC